MAFVWVALACSLAITLCLGASAPPLVHHAKLPLAGGWRALSEKVNDDHPVTLLISMKQTNLEELRRAARHVSDPRNPLYGHHLTDAQLRELTRPSPDHVHAVKTWLADAGAEVASHRSDEVLETKLSATAAATMLRTQFRHLVNDNTRQRAVLADDYWLPTSVDAAVNAIYGLHGLPLPPRKKVGNFTPAANVTPTVVEQTYHIDGISPSGSVKNRQAVAEFQGQCFNSSDLMQFFKKYVVGASPSASNVHKFVGVGDIGPSGDEAMLDVEYMMGTSPDLLTEFWYWGSMDFCADLKNWTTTILADDDAPLVHSVSYGYQGALTDLGCKEAQVKDIDTDFAKLAAKGISVIFASGDSGSGYPKFICTPNGYKSDTSIEGNVSLRLPVVGKELNSPLGCCAYCEVLGSAGLCSAWTYTKEIIGGLCTMYNRVDRVVSKPGPVSGGDAVVPPPLRLYPSWPASSPWVTSVGATRFADHKVGHPEVATDMFGSGGGFSWDYEAFDDQADAVKRYLAIAPQLPPASSFPPHGRATPDVSALGEGYQVVINGSVSAIGGTSASTPSFAAMVSLLNEARLRAGKPPMGHLNPWLYQNADIFTDVTVGSNAIGRGMYSLPYGFNCTKGWDPVTGLGTPRFDKMLTAANVSAEISSVGAVVV